MRFKSLHTPVTNQRIKSTCVAKLVILCLLLSTEVWSYAGLKRQRFGRQLNSETAVNYEDTAMANLYHQPHFIGNRTVVVQLFEWKFVDIAAECRDFLGPQGYAGVQLSPVLEHTVIKTSELNHPWWERYEVVSYRLASRSGDESEFWSMSRICNEHGVRIYADVVLNHMAAPLHFVGITEKDNEDFIVNTLLETNVNISQLSYANVSYTQLDFHRPLCMVLENAQDAHEIRNCQLNGHPDLNHSRGNVQKHIVEMLNKFVDMGVAGFRIDTARHLWPIDLKNIFKQVKNLNTEFSFKKNSRPFLNHDVFDLGLDTVSKTEYTTYGVVSEYLYPAELSTIMNGKAPLSSLINWGPALGFLPHEDSLVFIDSHDTQRGLPLNLGNNRMLTYKNRIKYIMANVFMLVHPYGAVKRIMSSYYFPDTNINQGPPVEVTDEEEIRSPKFNGQKQCTKESGWVCEHRWPAIVNVLKVASYFKMPGNKEESVIYFQTNGPNQVAFCRGHKAFMAINNEPEMDFVKEVYACLEPGIYCDVVTGGKREGKEECRGKSFEINESGYMKLELAVADYSGVNYDMQEEVNDPEEEESGKIESYGILVIYVESKIWPNKNPEAAEVDESQTNIDIEENIDDHDAKDIANSNEGTEGDKNPSKENAEVTNDDNDSNDAVQRNEEDNEDPGNTHELQEENIVEQSNENIIETPLEDKEMSSAENELQAIDKPLDENSGNEGDEDVENPEEGVEDVLPLVEEGTSEVHNPSGEKDSNENKENDEAEQSTENMEPAENVEENQNEETNAQGQDKNKIQDSAENSQREDEAVVDDVPTGKKGTQENLVEIISTETQEENVVESSKEDPETAVEHNQSRNMDKIIAGAEDQIEKPSGEIIGENNDASDAVTAKIQDIQKAGFFLKAKVGANNG